ncbi:MAG: hypothetical protein KatS3mg059_0993 [Thermomicrobiales bacterium]|nr:MAG: hypothetical protein KatS3mg059_0993 [Thermomicrobiales bacterium]
MALPAAGSAWLLLRASQNAWRRWTMLATGFLIGVATLLKPPGIVMLPLALAFTWLAGPVRISTIVCRWAWLLAGFAVAITPSLVHGWLIGWADFASAVTYRLHHRSATTVAPEEHLVALFELGIRVWPLLAAITLPLAAWWSWRGAVHNHERSTRGPQPEISILRLVAGRPPVTPGAEASILLQLWLLACLAGIAMGGNWFPHYLIQIAAPLAIWMAMLLRDLAPRLHRWQWWLLGTATGSLLLWSYSVVITTGGDAGALSRRLFDRESYPEQVAIASHLRACTAPESPVYIAFYQASIYYLADRPAAYRHLYRWELEETPGAEQGLVAMLTSPQRPVAIVDMHQQAPFPDGGAAFWRVVAREYHLETAINGHAIYRAGEENPQAASSSTACPHATNRHAFSSTTRLPAPPTLQPLPEGLPRAAR